MAIADEVWNENKTVLSIAMAYGAFGLRCTAETTPRSIQ
jgi:hypothetical protein